MKDFYEENELIKCSKCSKTLRVSDSIKFDEDDLIGDTFVVVCHYLCKCCVTQYTYTCEICNKIEWEHFKIEIHETDLCLDCVADYYDKCCDCNEWVALKDSYYREGDDFKDTPICEKCFNEDK